VGDVTHDDVVDNLPALVRGELDRSALHETVRHLRECSDCRAELVTVAEAHGTILAASRTLRPLAAGIPAVATQLAAQERGADTYGATPSASDLPPLRTHRTGGRRRLALASAAGLLVAAVTTGIVVVTSSDQDRATRQPAVQAQTAELAPLGRTGTGQVTIRITGVKPAGPGRFYYAWLLDPSTNKMLALGVVGPDGKADFEVDTSIVKTYHAVDVSLEDDNGDPAHSATSVLRGRF